VNRVRMINSVGELVAGEEHDLPEEVADRFIILGYAAGSLSRDYTQDEIEDIAAPHQTVSV
jgi:hypothetical protein